MTKYYGLRTLLFVLVFVLAMAGVIVVTEKSIEKKKRQKKQNEEILTPVPAIRIKSNNFELMTVGIAVP